MYYIYGIKIKVMRNKAQLHTRIAIKKYLRYKRKRSRLLSNGNVNAEKLNFLNKRIANLKSYLIGFRNQVKWSTSLGCLALAMTTTNLQSQSFGPVQTNPFSLTDIGLVSSPAWVDLDADGDLDMMSGESNGGFRYFENIGSATSPVYGPVRTNPFSLIALSNSPHIEFADLDGDGDLDLMSGEYYGDFFYFENIGTSPSPVFGAVQVNPFSLTSPGYNSSPTFVDLDNDGDLDLLSGEVTGSFYYYQNIGSASSPNFASSISNPFSLTDIGSRSVPVFIDLDADGDMDLMSGELTGGFYYFQNTGTVSSPAFAAVLTNPFSLTDIGFNSAISLADIENDGDMDLIAGESFGEFFYFQNCQLNAPSNTTPAADLSICSGLGTVLAVGGIGSISWYDATSGGVLLGTGSSYTTGPLTANTTFYAQVVNSCGTSAFTPVDVAVNPLPNVATTTTGVTITATLAGATYQWIDCNNSNLPISGETAQSFTASANGSFAVIIDDGTCSDTSGCVTINSVGISNTPSSSSPILIYPNPSNGRVTIKADQRGTYVLQNQCGQIVRAFELNEGEEGNLVLDGIQPGVYFVVCISSPFSGRYKLVVTT